MINNKEAKPLATVDVDDAKLTYDQIASELGVPKATVYAWVHRKQIPFIRLGKRLVRFSRQAISEWIRERTFAPKASGSGRS